MDEAKVVEVLRQVEWVGLWDYPKYACVCVSCDALESEGHRDDCKLAALLSEEQNEKAVVARPGAVVDVTDQGAVMVADLFKLLDVLGVPEGAGLYVCDPTDPGKRFIIRRVGEGGKEPGPVGDYERAMEAVGVAARAALRDFEGVWLSQRMRELGKALEVMDKARLRFFKEQR